MYRLGVDAPGLIDGIESVPGGVAQIVKQIAMDRISAGLGNGIDDSAGCLPQLRAVVARSHLEFLDGIHAVDVGNGGAALGLREERLAVVGAVHGTVVVQPRNPAIGHQPGIAVVGDVGPQ